MITPEQLAASGTEQGEQSALFCWAAINQSVYPELKRLFAIPNGGLRDKITAGRLKATGVKSGVPDIFLPVRRSDLNGLWIELKRKEKYKVAQIQKEWIAFLLSEGYAAYIAIGWEDARDMIVSYLKTERK